MDDLFTSPDSSLNFVGVIFLKEHIICLVAAKRIYSSRSYRIAA